MPEMLADFCMGSKTLSEIWFGLLHGGVNLPPNSGRLLHGVQDLARDSRQTLPFFLLCERAFIAPH